MCLELMAERNADLFAKCFGHAPRWVVAAPGRVNLIGEHTDYNEGFVLPMAIERYTIIAAERTRGRDATIHSVTTGETASFTLREDMAPGTPSWSNYIRGVIAGFQKDDEKLPGFNAVIDSSVPFSGGLSSSAALEVAAATLMECLCQRELDPLAKALLCQKAEHDFAGVPCGIMDQFTSILARKNHALLIDCRFNTFTPVPLADPAVTVLILNTNVRRRVADGEYRERRRQCQEACEVLKVKSLRDATMKALTSARQRMDAVVFRRARHVITENERTLAAARAIQAGHWPLVGKLMAESHASLRNDYEVSCPELDIAVDCAHKLKKDGVIGSRMTGAGFGGCTVCLVKTSEVQNLIRLLGNAYEGRTGIQPLIFSSRPANGARLLGL